MRRPHVYAEARRATRDGGPFLFAPVGNRDRASVVLLVPKHRGSFVAERASHRPDHGVLAGDRFLQGLAQVAQQVPSIEDMHRLGRALLDALGIHLGPIAGDDLDPGMAPQPVGDRLGVAIGQEVRDGSSFQVDDDRAVAQPAPPRPLVDGDHAT